VTFQEIEGEPDVIGFAVSERGADKLGESHLDICALET